MEGKCVTSADIDSTGCHSNVKSIPATKAQIAAAVTATTTTASYLRSPAQMSSKKQQLQLQTHNSNVLCERTLFESYDSSKHNPHSENDEGRGCSISMSTPAAENIAMFKDDDSRSGSSDDITTPITDLHHLHQHRHRLHKQQNGSNDADTTSTSKNTIEVIQDDRHCQESETTGGSVGVGIYLETPVIDEQIVGLNSHDYEKAKPKRLSDEFLLSSEDGCDDERNSSSDSNPLTTHSSSSDKNGDCNFRNSQCRGILKGSGILNDMLKSVSATSNGAAAVTDAAPPRNIAVASQESQFKAGDDVGDVPAAAAGGSMSFRFKNISIDYNSYDKVDDSGLIDGDDAPVTDVAENDVQSMDAIERRDFEHEKRLTGGIILKSSSLAKNDRLKLELVQPNAQNATSNQQQQRAVSSDSKCTYKDHSTTPTSSRHCSSRLTKSTAKINLSSSLSHPEITTNGEDKNKHPESSQTYEHDELDGNCSSFSNNHPKVQEQPESSESIPRPMSPAAGTSSESVAKPSEKSTATKSAFVELFSISNSNDSLASEQSYSTSSSHSLSHINKQPLAENSDANGDIVLSAEEDHLKKAVAAAESLQTLHQKTIGDSANDDDVATTSSSARCQYPALKYIRNSQRKDSTSALNGDEPPAQVTLGTAEERVAAVTSTLASIFAMNSNGHSNFSTAGQQQQLNHEVSGVHHCGGGDLPHLDNELHENDFDEETWADCEEGSDEEVCTCQKDSYGIPGKRDTSDMLFPEETHSKDVELSSYIQMVSISEDTLSHEQSMSPEFTGLQRKRKFNESRLVDTDTLLGDTVSGRKRIAYDYASTPRSSQNLVIIASPSTPLGRRTPRSLIPTRDNPPPELLDWLLQFQRWSHAERLLAVDRLIEHCEPTQVRHMMKVIEPQFQRDFISLLPRELALQVLAYLDPKDLLQAAQTCRSWRFLCDDNLLWKEKCRKAQILTEPKTDRPKRGRAGNMPPIASPWKAAYMRQHIIEMNWRSRPIREPKVLKGHDDHVITCLQFSGNRIVSGSDDNTLKVWSAVTGRCLRTLVGHTGGVWSSQMSGNIIISGSTDRTLKVWDMETGQCVHTLLGHTSTVRCMHLHGKKVVSGSRDATLRVWDIERGSCLHVLVGHLAAVRCVQYDGKLIVSGAYDYMVKIWHPERQECLHTLQGHTNRVYSLQFDGIHVVSGSLDTSIRVWDVETGNCKHTLMGHQSLTSGMELRQNILVSGNADSTVKVWDITSGQCLQTLSGPNKHQSAVTCLQFNSRFVITSSDDGTVKLWDVKTGEFIRNLVALDSGGSGGVVWRIRANDTKLICAVGSRNGTEDTKLMVLDFDVEGACVKCS